jgi:glycosyltransferase involved in cell wall biosynthesis
MTNLPPKIPQTEAARQELDTLRLHFGGDLIHLNPNQHSPIYLPRLLFGFHQLKRIRAAEASHHLHHLYNADPFPFPVVYWLRRPVLYSISSGVGTRVPNVSFFNRLAGVTVSDERSLTRLRQWSVRNSFLVRPGVDTQGFCPAPLPLKSEIRLMVGSAPWLPHQFRSKGIEALLEAAKQEPRLRLVCLWRGVLAEAMQVRVNRHNLGSQIEIINRRVDVNRVLASVHASITLVTDPTLIRPYPHSLVESLAAAKPVLVSHSIPMADYVELHGCGVVVETVTPEAVLAGVEQLVHHYADYQAAAARIGARDFSQAAMLDSFRAVYTAVLNVELK